MSDVTAKELPPQDFDALRAAILERKAELPKRLTQVAAYALDHPDEIAFGTAASIAVSADVQPSTLVRFAQHFGFDGFSGLQLLFRARLRERTSSYEERLLTLEQNGAALAESTTIFNGFISAAHRSIDAIAAAVEPDAFERAVTLLAKAETIYLIAKRRSYPISSYMAYAFGKLRVKCQLVGTSAGIDDDLLAMATPRDAAFAVSFSPYASESAAQARMLSSRGIPVVSLTDSAFSPLAECSKEWFEVVEADHAGFRSLSASMAFAMALTVSIAEKRRRQ
ncbi:MAG: MurR/RpiR family transcriptional regulator [Alphaproteobacteria bacterium]|jgi:DNA-binding MurR/RpiR family transcriptional regulator|uniref:MurR/RpiR family transcriptional regulator n=1 Tax=Devosia sp. XGJD_8 TaxID=3391187 RepID=UPI001E0D2C5B|nr:MurR/RpiR family transcriptional regulator [Alphaproteobacteria bacterium]MBU1559283.1 MurR/RpiR family transcriptional regulator [Alphaproteobacteria bacterium]MBU2304686.1 MurR/RpiR family transcriptional regulator [Alphaproteobacteria bacterium]MBU2369927.1 MurR/RpiR family transcriptional regulator [Alphaproteobacteria bacterium]